VVSTTVLLLPEFLPDLVEDDAVVLSFNDLQIVVRTPRPRTLLAGPLPSSRREKMRSPRRNPRRVVGESPDGRNADGEKTRSRVADDRDIPTPSA